MDTDYDNWAVIYACKQRPLRFKNEWVWILARENTLDDDLMAEAKNALRRAIRKFDFDRLVPVIQDDETCKAEDAPEENSVEDEPVGKVEREGTAESRSEE